MSLIQIIIIVFIVFAITKIIFRFREGVLTIKEFIIWILFWIAAATIIILPSTTGILAKTLGVGRGVDVIVYLSIILIFYILFKIKIGMEKIEQEITKVVQEQALKEERNEHIIN